MGELKRILIIKPSSLGDVATTLPLLCDLKRAHPGAKIDWLIHPGLKPVVEGHDAIHELIAFDRKKLAPWWRSFAAFKLLMGLLKRLRGGKYDAVVDAQGLLRSGIFTRVTGASVRVGFATAREGATLAYTDRVELAEGGAKMVSVDRMRELGGPLGTRFEWPVEFRMPLQPGAVAVVDGKLLELGWGKYQFVAMIPGARWDTKRWPIERYAEIAGRLLASGERVALLGSPDEKALCDELEKLVGQRFAVNAYFADGGAGKEGARLPVFVNVAGKTNLAEMIVWLERARLVVGNDSGPLHVAVALGKKTLSVYGPTDPAFVGPWGQMESVVRHDVPCFPCRNKECDHHSCMQGVTVELMWEKTRGMMGETTGIGHK